MVAYRSPFPLRRFDPTKGFPGEGPTRPEHAFLNTWQGVDHKWSLQAKADLDGSAPISDTWFVSDMSDSEMHHSLLQLACRGNSKNLIAARFQSQPDRVERLLGPESGTTRQAQSGSAYNLTSRPFQYRRPRTIPLQKIQRQAAVDEIERLMIECHAVEIAPEHDGDKALTTSAEAWERRPLPNGNWPENAGYLPIITSWTEQQAYDRRCVADMRARRVQGKPYRDFESAVFTVDKKMADIACARIIAL